MGSAKRQLVAELSNIIISQKLVYLCIIVYVYKYYISYIFDFNIELI